MRNHLCALEAQYEALTREWQRVATAANDFEVVAIELDPKTLEAIGELTDVTTLTAFTPSLLPRSASALRG
ncbi:MAG: hypothetical protein IPG50_18805 [Myxococcales bacterium]|nr:hypothetical protein [Myxococcales bacterium]